MDVGVNGLRGVHDAHWGLAWAVGVGAVAVPAPLSRRRGPPVRSAHPALRPLGKGARHSRGHARGAPQRRAHPGARRGREDPGLGPDDRLGRVGRTRGTDRPGGGLPGLHHRLVAAHARLPRRPIGLVRVRGGHRGDFPCAARGRCLRPGGHPRGVHGRDLRLRRALRRDILDRGAPPTGRRDGRARRRQPDLRVDVGHVVGGPPRPRRRAVRPRLFEAPLRLRGRDRLAVGAHAPARVGAPGRPRPRPRRGPRRVPLHVRVGLSAGGAGHRG